jgi:hypothetical protein
MVGRAGQMNAREFLFFCEDVAMAALPRGFPRPERRVMWTTLQLYYGDDPSVHFELQPHNGRGLVEVGLHFEGPVERNDPWAALVASHAAELMALLGPEWELEEWTQSWRRLHRTFRFEQLDADLGREVGAQFAHALQVLQPLVAEGAMSLSAPSGPPGQGAAVRKHASRPLHARSGRGAARS